MKNSASQGGCYPQRPNEISIGRLVPVEFNGISKIIRVRRL